MTRVEVAKGNRLSLPSSFLTQSPRKGGPDKQQFPHAWHRNDDGESVPRHIFAAGSIQVEHFYNAMRPSGRNGGPAIRRLNREHTGLMSDM